MQVACHVPRPARVVARRTCNYQNQPQATPSAIHIIPCSAKLRAASGADSSAGHRAVVRHDVGRADNVGYQQREAERLHVVVAVSGAGAAPQLSARVPPNAAAMSALVNRPASTIVASSAANQHS
jgi:hypothetical protein